MSALPTSIIAASSLNHGVDSGTDGTATVAVTVARVGSDSVEPVVGVAAATAKKTNVRNRLRIRSSLIPPCDRTSCLSAC
jgi:hypothetical protein